MKPVYLKWTDAIGSAQGWDHSRLKDCDGKVETLGFLLEENDDFLLVAGHVAGDQHQGAIAIPRDMITEYYEVVWQ